MSQEKELSPSNWRPLEDRMRETGRPVILCADFMWMWRESGGIEVYKHIDTRRYLLLDSEQRCWRQGEHGLEPADFESEFRRVTERI
jgi:hypothetical protein